MSESAPIIERVARAIAMGHGGKMIYKHPTDGMQTVASMKGFGHWGDSPKKYADAHWREYEVAAEFAIQAADELWQPIRKFRIGALELTAPVDGKIWITNHGEGGEFSEWDLAAVIQGFVGERL